MIACSTTMPPSEPSLATQQADAAAVPNLPPAANTPQEAASKAQMDDVSFWASAHERVMRVAAPLLIKNTELCQRDARPILGIAARNIFNFPAELRPAASEVLSIGPDLQILTLLLGTDAYESGLRTGDKIVAINGNRIVPGERAESQVSRLLAHVPKEKPLRMTVHRRAEQYDFMVRRTTACDYPIIVATSPEITSLADGRRILVTTGMLKFVANDKELAYVLAKEIAHNAINRRARLRMAHRIDVLSGLKANGVSESRPSPYPPVTDATADKLAIYMLARAGYDIRTVVPFWEKVGALPAQASLNSYSALHPDLAYRVSVMNRIVSDVQAKLAHKWPLEP